MRRTKVSGSIVTCRVGSRMQPFKTKPGWSRRVVRVPVTCRNGPFMDSTLHLAGGPYTLPFIVRGQAGMYVNGNWVPASARAAA